MTPDQLAAAFEEAALGELLGVVLLVLSLLACGVWIVARRRRSEDWIGEGNVRRW